jgi:hypothetical protein
MNRLGIPIEMLDIHGNSTLHYAAKAGHLDLCKVLIERGCSPARKNQHNQTPYDATDSHLVRQYLLPLIFKYENGQMSQIPTQDPSYGLMEQHSYNNQSVYPPSQEKKAEIPSQPVYNPPSYPPVSYSQPAIPTYHHQQSGLTEVPISNETHYSAPSYQPNPPTYAPPVANYTPPPSNANDSSNVRKIKAGSFTTVILIMSNLLFFLIQPTDGFHSSASDPQLQMKYGHIKPSINIAPPPIASYPGNTYSAYSSGGPAAVYNRYPVYDPLAAAPPAASHNPATMQPHYTNNLVPPPPSIPNPSQQSYGLPPGPPPPNYHVPAYQHSTPASEEEVVANANSSSVL